jgi:hypothetical protein
MTAAKKLAHSEARLETGTIERVGSTLEVRLATGLASATRAKSCLVQCDEGDRVLCAIERDAVFVLAVLVGASSETELVIEGDLAIQARGGRLAMGSDEGVDMAAPEVNLRAKKGAFAMEELGLIGRVLRADVGTATLVAQQLDSFCTRVMSRAKQVLRLVEELDQTRAGTIDQRARSTVAIRGENAVITARVLAKIDGEQIHLG